MHWIWDDPELVSDTTNIDNSKQNSEIIDLRKFINQFLSNEFDYTDGEEMELLFEVLNIVHLLTSFGIFDASIKELLKFFESKPVSFDESSTSN